MASDDETTRIFPDDDLLEDDEDSSSLNDVVPTHPHTPTSSSDTPTPTVTLAIPSTTLPPPPLTVALPDPKRKPPPDDSRRLFQRLWTDEDEIELLQGFLDYTSSRGASSSGHHHDTAAFYDQIKDKLQLEFNKNQLVEKLRRLKKKYRNVLSKLSSGKDFNFKSPHDQATFELSRKIWTNVAAGANHNHNHQHSNNNNSFRGVVEFEEEEQNLNSVTVAAARPVQNSSYVISHINLNNAAAAAAAVSPGSGGGGGGYDGMMAGFGGSGSGSGGGLAKLSSRKRPRVDKVVKTEGVNVNANYSNNSGGGNNSNCGGNVQVSSPLQGLVEETVRSCLSPVVKELINSAANGVGGGGGGGGGGFKGVSALALNAVPLNFSGVVNEGGGMDEKWRKQQILELEVYSKRLELVQDQIKLSLEELRSMGS